MRGFPGKINCVGEDGCGCNDVDEDVDDDAVQV